jgi:hypothetical protein
MPSSTSSTEAVAPAAVATPATPAAPRRSMRILRVVFGAALVAGWAAYLIVGLRARVGVSAVMLFLTGAALLWSVLWLYRSLAALATDPPAASGTRLGGGARRELERDKRNLLKAIKELEFDHSMGKLSDADFHEIAARYRASAVALMRRLDEGNVTYRALIEREVQRRLGTAAAAPAAPTDVRVCPACARVNDEDAAFCKSCGCRLEEVSL